MPDQFQKLFTHLKDPDLPVGLFSQIQKRILQEKYITLIKRKLIATSLVFSASMIGFIYTLRLIQSSVTESGLMEFVKLLFSDSSLMFQYWQTFGLALLESLPVTNLILFFSMMLIFLMTLRWISKYINFININNLSNNLTI